MWEMYLKIRNLLCYLYCLCYLIELFAPQDMVSLLLAHFNLSLLLQLELRTLDLRNWILKIHF